MVDEKQQYIPGGWTCSNSTCDYIIKDFVHLGEEQEEETALINEMKSD